MRVVSLQEFVKLPAGTIYSGYASCGLDSKYSFPTEINGLFKKGETIGHPESDGPHGPADFFYQPLLAFVDYNSEIPEVDTTLTRWGEFDHEAQFAVYEESDIAAIKEALST